MRQSITETELHAYADGQLSGEDRLEVEAFLAHNPEARRRVTAYADQNRLLREAFGPVLAEPMPDRLDETARSLRERLRLPANDNRWLDIAWRAAAAGVFLLAGGTIGYRLHTPGPERIAQVDSFAQEALQAHEFIAANPTLHTERDLRLVNQSLAEHIGDPVNEPDLSYLGFHFVGARTGAGQAGPFGQFVYRDKRDREVTMFVTRRDGPHGGFRLGKERGEASALYWSEGPLAYALVGNLPRDQLLALTRAADVAEAGHVAPRVRGEVAAGAVPDATLERKRPPLADDAAEPGAVGGTGVVTPKGGI